MRLDSFTVGYALAEDRLLLQAIGDGDPQSFWITRRAVLMIAEGVQQVLTEQYRKFGSHQISSEHVGDLLTFDHMVAAQKNPPKAGGAHQTVTTAPILVYQMDYAAEDADLCTIRLTDAEGQGYGYRLTAEMLHALLNLLQSQCDQAGWGIRLAAPTASAPNDRSVH